MAGRRVRRKLNDRQTAQNLGRTNSPLLSSAQQTDPTSVTSVTTNQESDSPDPPNPPNSPNSPSTANNFPCTRDSSPGDKKEEPKAFLKARARTPQRAENSNEVPEKSLRELQDELKTNIVETSDFAYFDADYFADDEASDSVMTDATQTTESSLEGRITTPAQDPNDADAPKLDLGGDGAGDALGGSELQEPDYSVEVKLSDLQADPNNPLFSVKTFEDLGLDERVLKGLTAMNFRKPSKVQERALPLLMANPPTNLVGQSQSGTGKTAAFVLNILSRIDLSTEQSRNTPQALILAPTRELARQIVGVISIMGRFLDNLVVGTAVPMGAADRPARLSCSVVVGTPGTVQEMMKKRILNPSQLKVLVLDEADNMLDLQGLGDQCIRVKSLLPKTIQVVLFSATFPTHVYRYAQTFAPNANEITLKHDELTVDGIKQLYMDCDSEEEKYHNLVQLYGLLTVGSSIIFVRTRESAREIERRMVAEGHTVASLTGGVEGSQRDAIIDAFRCGEAKVLITTNVLARGIDVSTVSLVVNYDIPEEHDQSRSVPKQLRPDYQTYLHRIGRTGRFGRIGVAITFVANRDEWEMLRMIQQHFSCQIERIDTSDWDEVEEIIKKTIKNSRAQAKFAF